MSEIDDQESDVQVSSGGFVIHRRLQAPADRIYAAFVEPEKARAMVRRVSWPAPANEGASRRGVEDMLDLIEAGISRGNI